MVLVKDLLRRLVPEAELIEANNGLKALELYETHHPDIILMDVQMPEMDGYTAATEIRARSGMPNKPIIIAVTAGVMAGEQERCFQSGMNDYLSKPIHQDSLREKLTFWLSQSVVSNSYTE
jgi:CheY-like chemotaxis protein